VVSGDEAPARVAGRSQPGWKSLFLGDNGLRSIVLAGAVALHGFFMFITTTVLPSIVAELGGVAFYAWVATLFGVGSITGAMLAPVALLRLSPRRAYQLGLLLFLVGSVCSALAPNFGAVIVGRALQGLAGGVLAAVSTSMIPQVFGEELRARALALVSSVWGPLALIGPLVGGLFAQLALWRGAFWLAVPLLASLGLLADRVLPRSAPRRAGATIFSGGQALRVGLIAGTVLVLSVASAIGTGEAAAAGIGLSVACVALALRLDWRARQRVLLAGAFGYGSGVGASSTAMVLLVLGVGAGGFIPYVLVFAFAAKPIVAGYVAALSSLAWTLGALASAGLAPEANRRIIAVAPLGAAFALLGVAWFMASGSLWGVAVAWTGFGASIGATWPHLASSLIGCAAPAERILAGGFVTTVQILAGTFGAALAGLVANLAGLASSHVPAMIVHGGLVLFVSFALPPLLALLFARRLLVLTKDEDQRLVPAGSEGPVAARKGR
jgi:MFS family permease